MKFLTLIFAFLLISISAYSQSQDCLWAKVFGGSGDDYTYSIAVDAVGNTYIAGYLMSDTFHLNNGKTLIKTNQYSSSYDGFLTKYDANGLCQWAVSICGNNSEYAMSVVLDASGNIYLAGRYSSPTVVIDGVVLSSNGAYEGFLAKFTNSGSCLWAHNIGGTGDDMTNSVSVDASGNAYIVGNFNSPTLNLTSTVTVANNGVSYQNAYIAKYNTSGVCLWAKNISGTYVDLAKCVSVDNLGNVFVTGEYLGTSLNLGNGISITNNGDYDAYLAKYDTSGVCQWAKNLGGSSIDRANALAVDGLGNAYLFGDFGSYSMSFGSGVSLSSITGDKDGYLAKFSSAGVCSWAKKIYGPSTDEMRGLSIDNQGSILLAGDYFSGVLTFNNNFALTNSKYSGCDGFLAKYDTTGLCKWAKNINSSYLVWGTSIGSDLAGNIYLGGILIGDSASFNSAVSIKSYGSNDPFVAKYGAIYIPIPAPTLYDINKTANRVNLEPEYKWSSVAGGTYYRINVAFDSLFTNMLYNYTTIATNFYISSYLLKDTKYYWRVKAYSPSDSSVWSPISSFTTFSDNKVFSWGANGHGQLGYNTALGYNISPSEIGVDTTWAQISSGWGHNLAIKSDGKLWAWGNNEYGELGDSTTIEKTTPVQIGNDIYWSNVVCGQFHSVALKTDCTLWTWGWNDNGQLGDSTILSKSYPRQIGSDNNWAQIAAGQWHTMAIKNNGTLWGWGSNYYGQLGDGTTTDKIKPTQIGLDSNWASIVCAHGSTFAIKKKGELFVWGKNSDAQLGDGTIAHKHAPTKIGSDSNWAKIACGYSHTLGLKKDGSLWAWGGNWNGQIGDSTITQRLSPVKIGVSSNWYKIACGSAHSLALKNDGSLWAWGLNQYGRLGDSTIFDKHSPIQIGKSSCWSSISCGEQYSIALKGKPKSISGFVNYNNSVKTPLSSVKVKLYQDNTLINESTTNANGYYLLDDIANGTYKLDLSTTKARDPKCFNIQDVAQIRMYVGKAIPFDTLQIKATNVNMDMQNGKPYVNIQDVSVLRMKNGGLSPSQWLIPDWLFAVETAPSVFKNDMNVVFSGANQIVNIKSLCSGDVNASFLPPSTISGVVKYAQYTPSTTSQNMYLSNTKAMPFAPWVKLMQNGVKIDSVTADATTGAFSFTSVPNGVYTLVFDENHASPIPSKIYQFTIQDVTIINQYNNAIRNFDPLQISAIQQTTVQKWYYGIELSPSNQFTDTPAVLTTNMTITVNNLDQNIEIRCIGTGDVNGQ